MIKKNYLFTLLTLPALLCLGTPNAWGETLTVADGTQTSNTMPVYGTYVDETPKYHSQFIYPKSLLEDLEGGTISKLEFYSSNASVSWGSAIRFSVKLAEVSETSPSGFLSPTFTTVFSDAALNISGNKLTIDFNQTNFTYTGANNLLLDVEVTTTGTYSGATFYGITSTNSGYMRYSNGSSNQSVLPKVTFTYTAPICTTCCKPVVTLDDYDDESASFSWTQGNDETQWQYLYLPAATTLTDSHWESATLTDSYTATITGLTKSTDYIFYIRSYCGVSSQSKAAKVPFTTACMVVKSLPFESDFSKATNYKMPDCWLADGLTTTGYTAPYVVSNSYIQFYGNNIKTYNTSRMSVIVLPKFTADIKNLKITVEYSTAGAEDATAYPQFRVGYLKESELSDPTKFHSLATLVKTGGTTTYLTSDPISLSGADSGSRIAICFNNISTTSTSSMSDRYGRLKSVVVESAQDCNTPQSVSNTAATGTTASFSWTAREGVPTYQYCVVARDADPDWSGNETTNTNSCTKEGLTASTNYDFYVKCVCGGGVAGPVQFTTGPACAVPSNVQFTNQVWNGATVTWDAGGDETAWNLRYKAGSGDWTTVEDLDATSYDMPNLTPGTTYTVQVEADCQAGWSDEATYTPACPALGDLTLSNEKYNGVTVSWSAATGISIWTLKYRKGSDDWTVVENIDEETYTISSGLVTNEEYTIELYSECGGDAASTTYTPVYAAPTSVLVSTQDLGGDASWAPVDGATGYEYIVVEKDATEDWTSPATGTTVSAGYVHANPELSGLHAKTAYDFYVKAVFAGGTSAATKKSFTTSSHTPSSLALSSKDDVSATFTWSDNASGAATRYQWACKTSGTPTDGEYTLLDNGVKTVTVTGLSASTNYTFYVRSYYEDGIYSSAVTNAFKTDCGIVNIGWSETFGSIAGTQPSCWTIEKWGTSANYWTTATDYAHSGAALKYNAKTLNNSAVTSPSINIAEKCTLCFYVRNSVGSGSAKVECQVFINDGTSDTEITNLTTNVSGTISSVNTRHTTATAKYYDLSSFVGKTITIRFLGKGYDSGTTSALWIDDVSINYKPISAPTLAAPVVTVDGAIVNWTHDEDGPFDLRYREKDAEPAAEWIEVNTINDKTKTLTGLTVGTEYEVQVRANISAHRISSWTASKTFTPINCPVPTSLEATEITHNSATISWNGDAKALRYKKGSDDWSNETISPADETFDLSELVAESTYTVQVKADCEDGDNWSEEFEFTTKCAPITITKVAPYEADFAGLTNEMPSCWDKSATTMPYVTGEELQFNGKDQTAILPKFSNATSTLMLKFNYKHSYAASYSGQIQVGYIDASGDFQTFGSALSGATSYTAAEINFDGVDDDEAKYIAIRLIHNNPSYISYADGFIKDVVVELAPTCYAPASIADAASITASGATLSWTASGKGETQYQWAVAEGSAAPAWVDDAAHKVTAPTTSVTLTGLNAQTDYTFYVRSYCNADDQSEEVSKAFTTKCAAIAAADMPFEEAFSATLGACWKTYAASYYSIYVSSGELHATAPKTSGSESVVVMPAFEMALNQLVVSFDYKGSNGTVEVGYVTDPEDKTTFVAVGDAYTIASAYQQAVTAFVSLGAVTGNVALRFKGVGTDGSFTVDNLRVAYGTGIADNTDNSEALADLLGQTVDFVVNRTFKRADYFNTLCLPFSLSEEELANSPFAGAELWTFKYASVVNDELQVRIQQETSIKAGRPYLILFGTGEDLVNPLFKNVTITATSGEHMNYENIAFIGTLAPVAFTADDANRLFLTANNLLAWANTNGNVRSFRAYFEITPSPHPSQIRRGMSARIVMKEEVATGIEDVQGSDVQSTKVLENNQVLIIRNGVKYNLQGQVVK